MPVIEIPLTRGMVALVDDEDAPLARMKWAALKTNTRGLFYAVRNLRSGGLYLHRVVLGITDPRVRVDHRNGDGLDCRRANLRVATPTQNARNARAHRDCRSGFKGVSYHPATGKWVARIFRNGVCRSLGLHATPEAAARAYDAAARQADGEFARPNFTEAT